MAKEFFKANNFRKKSLALIFECEHVIQQYQGEGLLLTLRQLYYQLVSRNVIANNEKSYQNLGRLVSNARLAGLLDWSAIEDRIRVPWIRPEWSSPEEAVEGLLRQYRLPRWEGQEDEVELWVEKDALAGVLRPIASSRHIRLLVNRGYSSQTAMYDSYLRAYRVQRSEDGPLKIFTVVYLGDHDPSGEDMVRDIYERLNLLFGVEVDVVKLAITPEQVAQYNPHLILLS